MSESNTFGGKGRNAVKWSLYEKLLKRGITFVISMFLARLLSPSDFGLTAMVGFFTSFAGTFADLGFGQALVQKKDVSQVQYSTVFYINVLIGVIIYSILYFSAPYIALFYNNTIITNLVRVSALSFIINSFTVVNSAILFKNLKLKIFAVVMLISSSLSGGIGVLMAYRGFGVWSLVGYGISGGIMRAILLWFLAGWKPELEFKIASIKDIWKTGLSFLNIGIINNVLEGMDSLFIGKIFSASRLGLYNRAKSLQELPLYTFVIPVTRPFFPMFSNIQDDTVQQKRLFYKTVDMLNFVVIMGFGLMFILAHNWIVILYSDKWADSVPYFKILILLIPMAPFNLLSTSLFKGVGKLKLLTFITIMDRSSVLLAMCFGYIYGLIPFLYVHIGFKIFVYFFRLFFVQRYLNINGIKVLVSLFKMLLIFIIVAFLLQYLYVFENIYIETALKSISFLLVYVFICWLFGVEGFLLFIKEVKGYFTKTELKTHF